MGKVRGYVPQRWPSWFAPTPIEFDPEPVGPFKRSSRVTQTGDVVVVPTPGHTPAHVSIIVRTEDVSYFLAGDTSYTEQLLLEGKPDGVSPKPQVTLDTMGRILGHAKETATVYLPSHDPECPERLQGRQILLPESA